MMKCYQLFTGLLMALRQLSEHLGLQSTVRKRASNQINDEAELRTDFSKKVKMEVTVKVCKMEVAVKV